MAGRATELTIELRDGKVSKGSLWEINSDGPLLVMIHGLTSDRNSSPFPVMAREFTAAQISTYRPDLYGGDDNARRLLDCDVPTHARDLEDILLHLRTEFPGRQLLALGHSLGGLSLVASNARFDGVVLLDASHPSAEPFTREEALERTAHDDWFAWNVDLGYYQTTGGVAMSIGKELLASIHRNANEEIKSMTCPVLVVCAEQGVLQRGAKEFYDNAPDATLVEVPGADHCFDNYGSAEAACQSIVAWIRALDPRR